MFLFLLRHDSDLTQEQLSKIFDENRLKYKEELKQKKKNKIRALKQKVGKLHFNDIEKNLFCDKNLFIPYQKHTMFCVDFLCC